MRTEKQVADFYRFLLGKNESEETACVAALALCRGLMPGAEDDLVRETAARAIASVRISRASANDNKHVREEQGLDSNKFPSGR
jgi:hypothetical protein